MPLTHRQKRVLFTKLVAKLLMRLDHHHWLFVQGPSQPQIEVAIDEWTIHNPRWVKVGTERMLAQDRVHNPNGLHPQGLAVDLLIYIDGEYVTNGSHPLWLEIDSMARAIDPAFGLGISFNDSNHLSYGE